MKKVTLIRTKDTGKQTIGKLETEGFSCLTLERPWLENAKNESCIPTGTYTVKWTNSPRFKRYMYEITGVEGRDGIRIHKGNYWYDVTGCVLLGNKFSDINSDGEVDILSSTVTIENFEKFMMKEDFILEIKNAETPEPLPVPTDEKKPINLDGKKTYIGLAVTLLGTLGLGKYFTDSDISTLVDLVMQISGIAMAVYGRYKATK